MAHKWWLPVLAIWAMATLAPAAAPLRALIVDGQNTHPWKATSPLLRRYLEETGLFAVDAATSPPKGGDMRHFKPQFADYNVVVNNYFGDPWPEETKKALADYVFGGGGLVIYHAVIGGFPDWKEYNEMTGVAGWGGRSEKDGPYIYSRDGAIIRDTTPGAGGWALTAGFSFASFPIDRARAQPPDHQGAAHGLYAFRGRTVRQASWSRPESDRVGHRVLAPRRRRHRRTRADLDDHRLRPRPRVSYHARALSAAVEKCGLYRYVQRGAEWAATGHVTQKVPGDFPGPDKPSIRQ